MVTSILPDVPRTDSSLSSKVTPTSSEMTVAPVRMAMSLRIAFLLSPKEGALTAATLILFWTLLRMRLVRGSLSMSSAMIRRGLFFWMAASRNLRIWLKLVTLCSEMRMRGF